MRNAFPFAVPIALAAVAGGCGGGSSGPSATATAPIRSATATGAPSSTAKARQGAALTGEPDQAAGGDIPDNQVFLVFRNAAQGYSMKFPEGWARRGRGVKVTFQDKNNLVRIETVTGARPTRAGVTAELNSLRQRTVVLSVAAPTVTSAQVIKVVYSTRSAPNPVTDKRVTLVVDRYYVSGPGKYAIVDLGTPRGVDNVDAYRLMIESFRWK